MGSSPSQGRELEGDHCGKQLQTLYWFYPWPLGLPPMGYLLCGVWHSVVGKLLCLVFVFFWVKRSGNAAAHEAAKYTLLSSFSFSSGPSNLPASMALACKEDALAVFVSSCLWNIYCRLSKKKKKIGSSEKSIEWELKCSFRTLIYELCRNLWLEGDKRKERKYKSLCGLVLQLTFML